MCCSNSRRTTRTKTSGLVSLFPVGIGRMSGDSRREEIGVFIKTSLGTRLALSVSPTTTVAFFIREVESAHFNCLPCFGEIKVQGFMVKHKSCFYHLSPLAPLLCALQDSKGPCFLHARAVQVNIHSVATCTTLVHEASQDGFLSQPCDVRGVECGVMTALERKLEQKCQVVELERVHSEPVVEDCEAVAKGNHLEGGGHLGDDQCMNLENSTSTIPASERAPREENFRVTVENDCASENSSATRSVTDIIRRHYPDTDTFVESPFLPERENNRSTSKLSAASPVAPDITPRSSGFFVLKDAAFGRMSTEGKRPDVGQRLLMASSKLGISPSNPSPLVSMYRSKGMKRFCADVQIRNPTFEMSESSG